MEETHERREIFDGSDEGDRRDASIVRRRRQKIDVHVEWNWAKGPEGKSTSEGMMISGIVGRCARGLVTTRRQGWEDFSAKTCTKNVKRSCVGR